MESSFVPAHTSQAMLVLEGSIGVTPSGRSEVVPGRGAQEMQESGRTRN